MSTQFLRFQPTGRDPVWLRREGDVGHVLDRAPWMVPTATGEKFSGIEALLQRPSQAGKLLVPVEPTKIVCIGRNYQKHAAELNNPMPDEPLLFFKPVSSLLNPFGTIVLPPISGQVEHEAEIGVVIGKMLKGASHAEALSSVFGITLLGDITARDLQKRDVQFTRAKSFDTFCPVGPVIVASSDTADLEISGSVNGVQRQLGRTSEMKFSVPDVIAYISQVMTLWPGDLIATGTPHGVGPLVDGDELEIQSPAIGSLKVSVRAPQTPS